MVRVRRMHSIETYLAGISGFLVRFCIPCQLGKQEDKWLLEGVKKFKNSKKTYLKHNQLFSIMIFDASNLEPNTRVNVEGAARNSDPDKNLSARGLEEAQLEQSATMVDMGQQRQRKTV